MAGILQKYFPMIRTRREMLEVIFEDERLSDMYLDGAKSRDWRNFCHLCWGSR